MMYPTPYPEVNALLEVVLTSVQPILGSHFIGMYLDGSITTEDFDQDSDIDFVVVTDEDVSGELFLALQAMHDRIATLDSPYAIQLEGSYISQQGLRRYDPAHAVHPNLERGKGERLKMVDHDAPWLVHRWILRERGITVVGPAPHTLIDPVSPDDLRWAMQELMHGWATRMLDDSMPLKTRGYQSYVVLSLCRVLYTLQHGTVVSKRVAAHWAQEALGEPWRPLIERTWAGRHNPDAESVFEDVNGTLSYIRYVRECSQHFELPADQAS